MFLIFPYISLHIIYILFHYLGSTLSYDWDFITLSFLWWYNFWVIDGHWIKNFKCLREFSIKRVTSPVLLGKTHISVITLMNVKCTFLFKPFYMALIPKCNKSFDSKKFKPYGSNFNADTFLLFLDMSKDNFKTVQNKGTNS